MSKLRIPIFFAFTLVLIFSIHNKLKVQSNRISKNGKELVSNNSVKSLNNIPNMLSILNEVDKKWKPRKFITSNGSIKYSYIKLPGELELSVEELEERINK